MQLPTTGFFTLALRTPAVWIGIVAAISVLAWRGYSAIYDRGVDACEGSSRIALVAHIQRAQEQARKLALEDAEFSEAYEIYRTRYITKVEEVTREIPADCVTCRISPVGLSLINAARAARLPMAPDTGEPDAAVPTPAPAPNGGDAGTRWRVFTGQPSVQRLRGETPATDPSGEEAGI